MVHSYDSARTSVVYDLLYQAHSKANQFALVCTAKSRSIHKTGSNVFKKIYPLIKVIKKVIVGEQKYFTPKHLFTAPTHFRGAAPTLRRSMFRSILRIKFRSKLRSNFLQNMFRSIPRSNFQSKLQNSFLQNTLKKFLEILH